MRALCNHRWKSYEDVFCAVFSTVVGCVQQPLIILDTYTLHTVLCRSLSREVSIVAYPVYGIAGFVMELLYMYTMFRWFHILSL